MVVLRSFVSFAVLFVATEATLSHAACQQAAHTGASDGPLVVRTWMRVTSPAFDPSRITSPRVYHLVHENYCGIADFHFWLLSEREDLLKELRCSDSQAAQLKRLKPRVVSWRKKYSAAIQEPVGPDNKAARLAAVQEIGDQIDKALSRILDPVQRNRLRQLANQLELSRQNPKNVMLQLAALVEHEFVPAAIALEKRVSKRELLQLNRELREEVERSGRKTSRDYFREWFAIALNEDQLAWLKSELDLHSFRPISIQEYRSLGDLGEFRNSLEGLTLEAAWRTQSTARLAPTGVFTFEVGETDESGATNVLLNCVFDATFRDDLLITGFQKADAEAILRKHYDKARGTYENLSFDTLVEELFLPHQMQRLEERTCWREVEIYGLLPCLVHGRLSRRLEISPEDRDRMIAEAPGLRTRLDAIDVENWRLRMQVWRRFFDDRGECEMFDRTFGDPPKSSLFPQAISFF